nr:4Fe-4S binding protein [Candidatus Sigynarchaeota archaeon]
MASMITDGNKRVPDIDKEACMGCGLCQDACNYMREGYECLILRNGVMCCIEPDVCISSQPGCEYKCIKLCPNKAFRLKLVE